MSEIKRDPEWDFEEKDDERTWEQEKLIELSKIDDYWGAWRKLLLACGQTNHYRKFYDNLRRGETIKVQEIAERYQHDLEYFERRYRLWWKNSQKNYWELIRAAEAVGALDGVFDKREFLKDLLSNPRKIVKIRQIIKTNSAKYAVMSMTNILRLAQARADKPIKHRSKKSSK